MSTLFDMGYADYADYLGADSKEDAKVIKDRRLQRSKDWNSNSYAEYNKGWMQGVKEMGKDTRWGWKT